MKSHKNNYGWRVATCLAMVLALVILTALPAVGQTKPVEVVNTAAKPVPTAAQGTTNVAGTVNVGNEPSVNVANTPNVNVANTPSVTVGNDAATPVPVRDVDNPGRKPLCKHEAVAFGVSDTLESTGVMFTVPAGKLLVIEYVSVHAFMPAGQKIRGFIYAVDSPPGGDDPLNPNYALVFSPQGGPFQPGSTDLFVVGQPMRLYAEAGKQIQALFARSDDSGTGVLAVDFCGYLVDPL